jgi:hypothetical protein
MSDKRIHIIVVRAVMLIRANTNVRTSIDELLASGRNLGGSTAEDGSY